MAAIISTDDLPADLVAKVEASQLTLMVAGANAKASRVAPCLAGTGEDAPTEDQVAEAKLVLVGAVKRWSESGSGALSQQAAGPFSQTVDTRQRTGYNLWPSEINDLQGICKGLEGSPSRLAFSVNTGGAYGTVHAESCSLYFGATYCDCGADLAGFPLFEGA